MSQTEVVLWPLSQSGTARTTLPNYLFYKGFQGGDKRKQVILSYRLRAIANSLLFHFQVNGTKPGRLFCPGMHGNEDQGRIPVPITISRGMFNSLPFQNFLSSARISVLA